MGFLTFEVTDDLKKIVKHAMKAKERADRYGDPTPGKSLWLVHDDGVYLMSPGRPGLKRHKGEDAPHLVAYADGCDPNKDDDCWYTARNLVGGDDFVDTISAEPISDILDEGATELVMEVTPAEIRVMREVPMQYKIMLSRTSIRHAAIMVEADSEQAARIEALKQAGDVEFSGETEARYDIELIQEITNGGIGV